MQLDTGEADRCNNDHGLSPDGQSLAISHTDPKFEAVGHLAGADRRVERRSGSHRLDPRTGTAGRPTGRRSPIAPSATGILTSTRSPHQEAKKRRLTTAPGLDDGPDYSPDGRHIYFNSERTGTMKIWRMNADGTNQEQVTSGDDLRRLVSASVAGRKMAGFLSYDKSVTGHPADKDVVLADHAAWAEARPRSWRRLFGGQGTINVPSWSPDSKHVAFVSYRMVRPCER